MYGEWIDCMGWSIFINCCPSTSEELKMAKAKKFAHLLNNGYTPDIPHRKL